MQTGAEATVGNLLLTVGASEARQTGTGVIASASVGTSSTVSTRLMMGAVVEI